MSIRRRSLDLLFAMCDAALAPELVGELLKYLTVAELGVKEELVLKARRAGRQQAGPAGRTRAGGGGGGWAARRRGG
jgi:hypothetical protein